MDIFCEHANCADVPSHNQTTTMVTLERQIYNQNWGKPCYFFRSFIYEETTSKKNRKGGDAHKCLLQPSSTQRRVGKTLAVCFVHSAEGKLFPNNSIYDHVYHEFGSPSLS
jgi:hypothetical protein